MIYSWFCIWNMANVPKLSGIFPGLIQDIENVPNIIDMFLIQYTQCMEKVFKLDIMFPDLA